MVVKRERVAGAIVFGVARGRNAHDIVALGEDDNVLPVVAVSAGEATADSLVLLEVVLVHKGAVAVVASLRRIGVTVFELGAVAALALRRAGCALAGVGAAGRVDGGGVVAAVGVKVEKRLQLDLEGVVSLGQALEDVSLGEKRRLLERHRAGPGNGEEANRDDEELLHYDVDNVGLVVG